MMKLDRNLYISIREFCSKNNIDLFVTLLSAYIILIRRYTNQEDIVVGTISLNGHWAEDGKNRKPLINPIALRSTIAGDPIVSEVLENISKTVTDAFIS